VAVPHKTEQREESSDVKQGDASRAGQHKTHLFRKGPETRRSTDDKVQTPKVCAQTNAQRSKGRHQPTKSDLKKGVTTQGEQTTGGTRGGQVFHIQGTQTTKAH